MNLKLRDSQAKVFDPDFQAKVFDPDSQAKVFDPFANVSLSRVFDGSSFSTSDRPKIPDFLKEEFDVCVIGSGPGGAVAAHHAALKGLRTLLIEEGPFKRAQDFSQKENAASELYQEGMKRRTRDGSITILQGRVLGGSSTVNWTSSFRAPQKTLNHWCDHFLFRQSLRPRLQTAYQEMEDRLSVQLWDSPNQNNVPIRDGCEKLNWKWGYIPRNVKSCWNIGFCGMGCPTNAKQSALNAFVPEFLNSAGALVTGAKAQSLVWRDGKVLTLALNVLDAQFMVRAKKFVVSAGGIGSPALLLRSQIPDPFERVGKRTFLHPVVTTFARFKDRVDPYFGAPQSVYSDQFLWPENENETPGFKLEAMPLAPMFTAGLSPFKGSQASWVFQNLSYLHGTLALQRDGFCDESQGGSVSLDPIGNPIIDYEATRYQYSGFKNALLHQAEMQFAAGALEVLPLHVDASRYTSWKQAVSEIENLIYRPYSLRVGSAHVMGGCALSEDKHMGVVDSYGKHHHMENLFVIDGSVFPTSLGSNPQMTVFALARVFSERAFGELE